MKKNIQQFIRLPLSFLDGITYHLGNLLSTPKPRMIQFPVCDRCNSRCIMCNRWEKTAEYEISLDRIRTVFDNPLFSQVEFAALHGGEPTLRKDLSDIAKIIQDACPKLKQIWISTNGFGASRVEKRILEVLNVLDFKKIDALEVNVSIDGIEETHDKIRGIPGGFRQSMETIQKLRSLSETYPLKISIGTVIQPLNLYQLDKIENLANELGVTSNFQPLMFDKFFSVSGEPALRFSEEDMREFYRIMQEKLAKGHSTTNFYWSDLLSMMNGAKRKSPCAFDRYVFSLYPTGEVLPCSREDWIVFGNVDENPVDRIWYSRKSKEIRRKMRKEVCPTCSNYCGVEFSLQKEFFTYAKYYVRKHLPFLNHRI